MIMIETFAALLLSAATPPPPTAPPSDRARQVAIIGSWTVFNNGPTCVAVTEYQGGYSVALEFDFAENNVYLHIANPAWESVRDGQSYPNVTLHFSNGSDFEQTFATGVRFDHANGRTTGLQLILDGTDFFGDFAASAVVELKMGGTRLGILNLRGSRAVATRLVSCSAAAFRSHPTDPFRNVPPPPSLARPAAPTAGVVGANARANLTSYISDSDYPASAIRAREQGIVSFHLSIGTDGRVTDCTITTSSGSQALDDTTCRIMRSRARFTPARDSHGNPTADTHDDRVRWILPVD